MSDGGRVLAFVAFGLALWTSAASAADFQYGFTSNVYLESGAVDATGVLQQKSVVVAITPHGLAAKTLSMIAELTAVTSSGSSSIGVMSCNMNDIIAGRTAVTGGKQCNWPAGGFLIPEGAELRASISAQFDR